MHFNNDILITIPGSEGIKGVQERMDQAGGSVSHNTLCWPTLLEELFFNILITIVSWRADEYIN